LRLRSKPYLQTLSTGRHLSVREIANPTELSRSVVLAAMDRFGMPLYGNGHWVVNTTENLFYVCSPGSGL
jgi:hypothetical protein